MFSSALNFSLRSASRTGVSTWPNNPPRAGKERSCASDSTPAMTDTFTMQSSTAYYAKQHHWNCIPAQRWT